jgi:hypothetical protein
MKKLLVLTSVFLFYALASGLYAQGETLPPHVHGTGGFNVTIEGTEVDIDYDGPLANFISFEHRPNSPAEYEEQREMMKKLNDPGKLFSFSADWACTANPTNVEGDKIPEDVLGHPHAKKEEGHAHSHEHGNEEDHEHEHGDEADHDHEGEHSDVEVEFSFNCPKLTPDSGQIDVKGLFDAFPNLNDVDVQLVRPGAQSAYELSPDKSVIKW